MPRPTLVKIICAGLAMAAFSGTAIGYAIGDYVTEVMPTALYADMGTTLPDRGTALALQSTPAKAQDAAYRLTPDDVTPGSATYQTASY